MVSFVPPNTYVYFSERTKQKLLANGVIFATEYVYFSERTKQKLLANGVIFATEYVYVSERTKQKLLNIFFKSIPAE